MFESLIIIVREKSCQMKYDDDDYDNDNHDDINIKVHVPI